MEEIDLKEVFNIFWNQRIQILLIILIFAVIGIIYTLGFVTPKYSSSTSLVLTKSSEDESKSDAITTTDITINSKLVSTYSVIVKSKDVLKKVNANLNINLDEKKFNDNVTVSSVQDAEVMKITVTDEDPVLASKIANEIAKVFSDKVKEIYSMNNVKVLDKAEVEEKPSNINYKRDIAIFAFIGAVVAVAYVLIINMLDTTIKTPEEVEQEYKLPVLASIPLYETTPQKSKRKGGRKK